MCLFDHEAIPDHLLRENYVEDGGSHINFGEDITGLRAYHLIGLGVNENLFNMHQLGQLSTDQWLKLHGKLEKW